MFDLSSQITKKKKRMFQNYHRMEAEILSSYQNHEVTQGQSIKYINLPSVYEQVENTKKNHLGKIIISA